MKNLSGQQSTPVLRPINDKTSEIPASFILFQYLMNFSQAAEAYSGKVAYLGALVANVEYYQNGGFESCVQSNSIGGYLVS